jgi:glycosyltransferase involved in cell wall biosynthesis
MRALAAARRRITPHEDVARVLEAAGLSVRRVPWSAAPVPVRWSRPVGPPLIVFAASALARKGVHELAEAARAGGWRVRVLGTPAADASVWRGVEVEHAGYRGDWLARGHVAVLPAFVEHRPRALLQALAAGMPVVATAACGLPAQPGLTEVPAGDAAALRRAIEQALRESPP